MPFAETLALISFGTLSARLRRIPAAPLLLPLGLGIALQDAGLITIELPLWLLAAQLCDCRVEHRPGIQPTILRHAAQALPRVVMSILVLMAVLAVTGERDARARNRPNRRAGVTFGEESAK